MDKKIVIDKNLKFDYSDLMLKVDTTKTFTLMDVFEACVRSKIPKDILCKIMRCHYIFDLYKEAKDTPFKRNDDDAKIEALELSLWITNEQYNGKKTESSYWSFNGRGKRGHISKDIRKTSTKKQIQKMLKDGWCESYALEFTPLYELSGYTIEIADKYSVENTNLDDFNDKSQKYIDYHAKPAITLNELLYWIFWELSFCGGIEDRNKQKEIIMGRLEEVRQAEKDGTLNKIMVPWEEVKKRIDKVTKKGKGSKK